MTSKRLAVKLRRTREAKGVSQYALAKKARVSQGYISALEAGAKRSPGVDVLQRLAKALGVPVTELLG